MVSLLFQWTLALAPTSVAKFHVIRVESPLDQRTSWVRTYGREISMKLKALEISFVEQVSDGILNFNNGNVKANSENRAIEQVENRASEFSFPWESERDFKFVLDWKIYLICNFAHFRSRWIKTQGWYLNSHDLINIFFTYLLFGCQEKLGEKKICRLVSVLCFEGKVN